MPPLDWACQYAKTPGKMNEVLLKTQNNTIYMYECINAKNE